MHRFIQNAMAHLAHWKKALMGPLFTIGLVLYEQATGKQPTLGLFAALIMAALAWQFYSEWKAEQKKNLIPKTLEQKLVPGPELAVAYDTGIGNMLNWSLCVRVLSGGTAYQVKLDGLKYGDFAAELEEIDRLDTGGNPMYFTSSNGTNYYGLLLAAIAGTKSLTIPVTVECRDASNNRIQHFFDFEYKEKAIPNFRLLTRKLIV
jgi:hypothetical protein